MSSGAYHDQYGPDENVSRNQGSLECITFVDPSAPDIEAPILRVEVKWYTCISDARL
jgi:hypothetical protein